MLSIKYRKHIQMKKGGVMRTVGSLLPKQLIRQPSVRPLDMSVFLMSLFIQFPSGSRKCFALLLDICRIIIHSKRAHTRNTLIIAKNIYFLVGSCRWFDTNSNFPSLFSCIVGYVVCHIIQPEKNKYTQSNYDLTRITDKSVSIICRFIHP
jgi:hypothetical protein